MSEAPPEPQPQGEFSTAVRDLGKAISQHPGPVHAAFCGIKLYVEVLASGRVSPLEFLITGHVARGDEPEGALKVPVLAIAGKIPVSFDPTLPPEGYRLAP